MESLPDLVRGRVVLLGVGNALRGDDGAGSRVAAALAERHPKLAFDGGQAPENFLGPVSRACPDTVILADAADFGEAAGAVRIVDASEVDGVSLSTHGLPLGMLMSAISESTGALVYLVAIQIGSTGFGDEMCDEVAAAVERLIPELGGLLARSVRQ
jgi:hydrogenase 3 maturation protease